MIRKYHLEGKCVVTSFIKDAIYRIKEYASELHIGLLKKGITDEIMEELKEMRAEEVCPHSSEVTPEKVAKWHREGFNVRAWGVDNEKLMRNVYDSKVDGMTVNFPDKLVEYITSQSETT